MRYHHQESTRTHHHSPPQDISGAHVPRHLLRLPILWKAVPLARRELLSTERYLYSPLQESKHANCIARRCSRGSQSAAPSSTVLQSRQK